MCDQDPCAGPAASERHGPAALVAASRAARLVPAAADGRLGALRAPLAGGHHPAGAAGAPRLRRLPGDRDGAAGHLHQRESRGDDWESARGYYIAAVAVFV